MFWASRIDGRMNFPAVLSEMLRMSFMKVSDVSKISVIVLRYGLFALALE